MHLVAVVQWHIALPVALGLLGIYLLLPRPQRYPPLWGALLCAAALVLAGWLLTRGGGRWPETVLFYTFSAIALLGGGMLVTQRNPVHAALSFALVVLSSCGLFLLQAAPFLMAATIIVYAGAIVVTFLFVVMLAQQEGRSDADERSREPLLSTIASFVLLGALLYVLKGTYDTRQLEALIARARQAQQKNTAAEIAGTLGDDRAFFRSFESALAQARGTPDLSQKVSKLSDYGEDWIDAETKKDVGAMKTVLGEVIGLGESVKEKYAMVEPPGSTGLSTFSVPPKDLITPGETVAPLGRALFTDYLIAVELAGTLLLVATIGAIAVASRRTEGLR